MLALTDQLDGIMPTALEGSVVRTVGMTAAVAGFPAPVGAVAEIQRESGASLEAEVVGFRDDLTLLYPLSDMQGVRRGNRVRLMRTTHWLRVGPELLGRVIDGEGRPSTRPQPALADRTSLDRRPPNPVDRPRIDEPLSTGVRAIDGLLTCGKGQRMGIFCRLGRGQERAAGHDGPLHVGRRERHRADRRTRPRSERIHRARLGPGGSGQERRRRGHQRRAGPGAHRKRRSPPRPSPNTSATRARTCCC